MSSELPESGMATGNDESPPDGGPSHAPPLDDDERAILDNLKQPGPHVVDPVEDTVATEMAVADDAPLVDDEEGTSSG